MGYGLHMFGLVDVVWVLWLWPGLLLRLLPFVPFVLCFWFSTLLLASVVLMSSYCCGLIGFSRFLVELVPPDVPSCSKLSGVVCWGGHCWGPAWATHCKRKATTKSKKTYKSFYAFVFVVAFFCGWGWPWACGVQLGVIGDLFFWSQVSGQKDFFWVFVFYTRSCFLSLKGKHWILGQKWATWTHPFWGVFL